MAARNGMSTLISELRRRADAGTAEFSLVTGAGTVNVYSDDDLQATLDRYRADVYRAPLDLATSHENGTAVYHDYYWQRGEFVEEAASGTAAWRVEDSAGSAVGTAAYTVNYGAKHIRFTASTGGTAYFLTYRTYDLDRAAADVWQEKAAHISDRYDLKTDNHDLKRSQLFKHYMEMASFYRRKAPARSVARARGDVTGC